MKASISWVAMLASAKSAPRRHLRLKIENQTSIKLNQDACTGRKWNTNVRCGWASSQLTTSADQCELDRVQDQMDRLAHGRLLVEQGRHFAELARAVLHTDHAAHLAIIDPEASQQVPAP